MSEMSDINIPLLRKVMEHAIAHPEEVDLGSWAKRTPCGTALCIAGTATVLTGHEINWNDHPVYETTDGQTIRNIARVELGLPLLEADKLFHSKNMDQVWDRVEALTDGEVSRPADARAGS